MNRRYDPFKKKTRTIEYPRVTPDPTERLLEAETKLAALCGAPHAVVFDKPASALYCAARALDLPSGAECLVPALERAGVTLALELAGLQIGFSDTHEITHTLDPAPLPDRIAKRTECVLVSCLFGHPAHFAELKEICAAHKVRMIEYSRDALGGIYRGVRNGSHGDVSVVGFPAAEGAACLTADPRLRERLLSLRDSGIDPVAADARDPSLDFAPSHAALLEMLKTLRDLEDYLEARYGIVKEYARRLERHPHLVFPPVITTATHTYRALVARVENAQIRDALHARIRGLGFRPRPDVAFLPEFERYRRLHHPNPKSFPHAMRLARTAVEFPLDIAAGSTVPEELERVIIA